MHCGSGRLYFPLYPSFYFHLLYLAYYYLLFCSRKCSFSTNISRVILEESYHFGTFYSTGNRDDVVLKLCKILSCHFHQLLKRLPESFIIFIRPLSRAFHMIFMRSSTCFLVQMPLHHLLRCLLQGRHLRLQISSYLLFQVLCYINFFIFYCLPRKCIFQRNRTSSAL